MKKLLSILFALFFAHQAKGSTSAEQLLDKAINSAASSQFQKELSPLKYKANSTIDFDLKLVNVDTTSAQFEIIDDNKTTINYAISYTIQSKDNSFTLSTQQISETTVSSKSFEMQTNSISLLNKQEELLQNRNVSSSAIPKMEDNGEKTDSGESYNSEERLEIKSKTWQEVHRFLVNDLEPNRLYEIKFDITAKLAHLSSSLIKNAAKVITSKKSKETKTSFKFNFVTPFDVEKTADLACKNARLNTKQTSNTALSMSSSCYLNDNDCTKCKPTCFKREPNKIGPSIVDLNGKPILCEPCPCDQSKSTGECMIANPMQQEGSLVQSNNFQPPVIKCKQCIEPYTGDQCKDCDGEGIDFYKNEDGICVKCECNNNARLDSEYENKDPTNAKRKCSPITGKIIFT